MDSTLEAIERLTNVVEAGFGSVADDVADIRGDITELKREMATKEDLRALKRELEEKLASKQEVSLIVRELDDIKDQLKNIRGFGREIDHALERIAVIEQHLGINKQIAE
jgi:cell fate (sporulation/competence/biofilm development) regulator YlbF (YheA/YmcA/DUF963 family)